ncbi:ribonuclease H-like domain-containing protein [Tanacetum coccineum]
MRLKTKEVALPVDSSSPMVLMAQTGNDRRPSNSQVKSWRPCFNFAKGSCRFRSECRYAHDSNAKSHGLGSSKQSTLSNTDALLAKLLDKLGLNDVGGSRTNATVPSLTTPSTTTPFVPVAFATQNNPSPLYYLSQPVSPYMAPPGFTSPPGPIITQPAQAYVTTPPGFGPLPAQYSMPQVMTQQQLHASQLAQQPLPQHNGSSAATTVQAQQPQSGPTGSVPTGHATLLP